MNPLGHDELRGLSEVDTESPAPWHDWTPTPDPGPKCADPLAVFTAESDSPSYWICTCGHERGRT